MCRLFGALFTHRLEADWLEGFRCLADCGMLPPGSEANGHRDSWGLAAWTDKSRFLCRAAEDAFEDEYFLHLRDAFAEGNLPARGMMAHLRLASKQNKVSGPIRHAHPFYSFRHGREWFFAHNGTVRDADFAYNADTGLIDSQILMDRILGFLTPEDLQSRFAEAVCQAIRRVEESLVDYTSLCCLLSDGESLAAYRSYSDKNAASYYTLHSIFEPGSKLVVCSERLAIGRSNWEPMSNRECLVAGPELEKPARFKL
ncbi:MAG: class II glutamine amidotransferase [Armatimonadetes bacterium]|nr:class II glutamine amidotransferase [Armatimonadota bacterium]